MDHLVDALVPDGMGGGYHVDYLLLTQRGVVVIDLRDVRGNIFGADQMAEWTVMDGPHRFTFTRSEEHTSELQSHSDVVCRLLLEEKNTNEKTPQLRTF